MITAKRIRIVALALTLGGVCLAAVPAAAQSDAADARLNKVEAEIRALQRKVFPDGAGKTFAPEVTPGGPSGPVLTPATSAVTDILGRLDAIEGQLARLTAQSEENANGLAQLTTRVEALEAARAHALAQAQQPVDLAPAAPDLPDAAPAKTGVVQAPAPAKTPPAAKPKEQPVAKPSPARIAAVQKIAKPQTDDAGDDEYTYGFRLWEAQFYPEAEQQLRLFIDKYPDHARISYGRNLLGRAYLDDGKPAEAAPWFLKNYQSDKQGARAADSLLYLSEAMIALKDTKRACIALAEFGETYPAVATGRLQDQYQADKGKVTCN
jgi:TolA-binding protein